MKTGTSAVAAGFTALERSGALPPWAVYPLDELWPLPPPGAHIVKHLALKAIGRQESRARLSVAAGDVEGALARIATHEIPGQATGLAIFVYEMLALRLVKGRQDIRLFDAVLREHFDEVEYLLTVRRQDEAVRSAVHQAVRGHRGERLVASTDLRIANLPDEILRQYDYWGLYRLFGDAGLSDSLKLVPFVESDIGTPRHLTRMTEAMGIGLVDTTVTDLDRQVIHPSLSKRDLDRIARIRSVQRRFRRDSLPERALDWTWKAHRDVSTRMAMRNPHKTKKRPYERWKLTPAESTEILEYYRTSNEQLFAAHPEVDFLTRSVESAPREDR
jgi:hypothetical protein